ncbi:MAG: NAD-dependent epimerase/dehydratase family protein [Spirochaetaceae bacterium]|jgi:dihydroflavonol-4-reductase|nr:NAD-dependent epimerase/dehydratase family protein [Spirochaetaceae bacterium]
MGNADVHVVTGANGRTGLALCAELKARGCFVRAFIRKSAERYRPFLAPYVDEFAYGDVREAATLDAAFSGARYVYHLAGIVSIDSRMTRELFSVNVDGTRNVIAMCVKNRIERLVYTGTVHTLHFSNNETLLREIPCRESPRFVPERVRGPYAYTKALASNLVLDAVAASGLNAVIAMPSGITGAYELKLSNFGRMIADVAEGRLPVFLKGRYDFVNVRDVVKALADLAGTGAAGESFVLCGHKATVKEIVGWAARAAGRRPPALCLPRALARAFSYPAEFCTRLLGRTQVFTPYSIQVLGDNCNFSHEKISALTGYAPGSVEEAVSEQVAFYQHEYKARFLKKAHKEHS